MVVAGGNLWQGDSKHSLSAAGDHTVSEFTSGHFCGQLSGVGLFWGERLLRSGINQSIEAKPPSKPAASSRLISEDVLDKDECDAKVASSNPILDLQP
jgi:hypothetical protein